jgi:two-component sensor histidine kinase
MREDRSMPRAPFRWLAAGSARARLTLLLTLALLPLGVIAVVQAREVARQAQEMSQRALLGETLRAAAAQREVIRTAQGQASALVPLLRDVMDDTEACSALMAQLVEGARPVVFAGLLRPDGRLDCASDDRAYHMGAAAPGPAEGHARVETGAEGGPALPEGHFMPSQRPVLVMQPVPSRASGDAAPLGTIVLSLPRAALVSGELIPGDAEAAIDLTTFNAQGEVLWASPLAPGTVVGEAAAAQAERLPAGRPLESFIGTPAHTISAVSGAGDRRAYAIVPVVEGELATLGSWAPGTVFSDFDTRPAALPALLPLAMWALSLVVVLVAVNQLLLAPLGALRQRMQAFTAGTRTLPAFGLRAAPDELRTLADSFDTMIDRIVRDERRLEKSVHDQEVLLKEVHHRVKNNLQLIASILNMQLRQHRSPESRAVLRRVQDRVMSLATVHQHLYETTSLSALRADTLLGEIVNRRIAEAGRQMEGVALDIRLAPVRLYPDQAVPLSLLVGEAVTNVLYHVGRPADGSAPWVRIVLQPGPGAGEVTLEVANSGGARIAPEQDDNRSGLGMRLIAAFADQLEGELTLTDGETADGAERSGTPWRLMLRFAPTGLHGRPALDAPEEAASG